MLLSQEASRISQGRGEAGIHLCLNVVLRDVSEVMLRGSSPSQASVFYPRVLHPLNTDHPTCWKGD